ncbi:MAG TPA: glycosyltransferase, partial [Armatimonadota bacterium]|nr:glycosyltransferase [Armatimonadota bacterium]
MSARPSVSLCVIARDEAARIQRCLASAREVVDEIVVVDTGSVDDTAALAEAAGARVFHCPWCDDFAAARNAALDRATGEWILRLDADEELLPESVPLVREVTARDDVLAAYVYGQQVESESQTGGFIEMRHLRLWRDHPRVRYVGRIHEHFGNALEGLAEETQRAVVDTGIRIRHWGYLPAARGDKLRRAVRLLEMELEDRPDQLYYEIELGRTWCLLGDPRGSALLERALRRVLETPNA